MPRTFSVEAAKTDRSTCKSCNKKIALKGLRIGTHNTSKQGIDLYTKWFHPACFKKKIKKGPTSKKSIAGFDKLKPNQQKLIKKHVIDVFATTKHEDNSSGPSDLFSSSDSSSDGDALNETTKKKEETKKGKKSKPAPSKQHEQDVLLKMDIKKEEEALKCSVCSVKFETERSLKFHQDIAHKQLREQNNKERDDKSIISPPVAFGGGYIVKDIEPNRAYIEPYNERRYVVKEEKKEEIKEKKPKSRSWTQHERENLLKMHKEGKSLKVMADELKRTESATKQKLRLLLIQEEEKKKTCSVCSAKFDTEKSLKLHQSRKQDIAHKQLREQHNKEKYDKSIILPHVPSVDDSRSGDIVKDVEPNRAYIKPYNEEKEEKKEEIIIKGKKPKSRSWKQDEKDSLLKMHKEGKSLKVMADELKRTESATKQKLRLLIIIEEKKKTCSVCSAKFETEKSLKLHQAKKQDDEHKKWREQNNKKQDDNTNNNKKKKCKVKKIKNTNTNTNTNTNMNMNNNQNTTNINITIESKPKRQREEMDDSDKREEMDNDDFDEPHYKKRKVNKLQWNVKQCAQWMESLGDAYKKYTGEWKSSGITGALLNDLDDDDLEEIVKNKIHRKAILRAWKRL